MAPRLYNIEVYAVSIVMYKYTYFSYAEQS
jgi:hypothetical protein